MVGRRYDRSVVFICVVVNDNAHHKINIVAIETLAGSSDTLDTTKHWSSRTILVTPVERWSMDTRRIEMYLALQTMLVAAGVLIYSLQSVGGVGFGLGLWLGLAFPALVFVGVAGHLFVELMKTETPSEARDHEMESE